MKLKILNLNLWNYNDWEKRKPKIINFIKETNPDIIALQEIRDDIEFNKKGNHQGKQLKEELNYEYMAFFQTTDKRKERPEKYKHYCVEGTALISKYPIIKIEKEKLKKHPDDIYHCGNLFAKVKVKNKIVDFVVVHFSNNDLFSLLHLIETLNQIKEKKIKPLIAGDFNMYHSDWLDMLTKDDFKSSLNYKKYLSFPLRNWTLDYVLIPKKYKFKSLKCVGKGLSDHKALVVEVEI